MKTILAPTDFSHEAGTSVEYATAITRKGGYKLIPLHAFHLSPADILYTQIVSSTHSFRDAARDQLELTRDLISNKVKIQPECVFEEGSLEDTVSKAVKKKRIDLIIMGTHGAKGLKKFFSGSHTSVIIRNAQCPVISVPEKFSFKGLKKVAFATNYHRDDIEELRSLVNMVRPYNAHIDIVHSIGTEENWLTQIMPAFEQNVKEQINYHSLTFHQLKGSKVRETLHR